jgi:hypothetical protein
MSALATSGHSYAVGPWPALWGSWTITERVDDVVEIEGLRVRRVGLTAADAEGRVVTGSAASLDDSAAQRAESELCERAGLVDAMSACPTVFPTRDREGRVTGVIGSRSVFPDSDAPTLWQPSKSSGAAIGSDWPTVCRHAELELVERDRLLRSWYGLGPRPEPIQPPEGRWLEMSSYSWSACRVPDGNASDDAEVAVVCIVGFPRTPAAPLLRGFAAAHDVERARDRAMLECLQSLAFLWGEPIPSEPPPPSPTTLYHLDYYLWPGSHATLRDWLSEGGHARADGSALPAAPRRETTFVDLTPKAAAGRVVLVRAVDENAACLWFGDAPCRGVRRTDLAPHPVA